MQSNLNMAVKRLLLVGLTVLASGHSMANEADLQVAVIKDSPPLSYVDENGKLTGFDVEISHALCRIMAVRCQMVPVAIHEIIPALAQGKFDFAATSFIATPDHRKHVLFSKPYFQSVSFVVTKEPSAPAHQTGVVAVIKGSAQARHAKLDGWSLIEVETQQEVCELLRTGRAQTALLPMITAMHVLRAPGVRGQGFKWLPLHDPTLSGTVHMPVNINLPALVDQLNTALDAIKRNGQFDQINTRYLPFKLL